MTTLAGFRNHFRHHPELFLTITHITHFRLQLMNKTNEILFRDANLADAKALGAMLPQLADFDIPSKR